MMGRGTWKEINPFLMEHLRHFYFNIYSGRQAQIRQSINRFRRGLFNVHQTVVGTNLELIPCVFMHKGRAVHRNFFNLGGQGNGAFHDRTRILRSLDDGLHRLIYDFVVKGTQFNAYFLTGCFFSCLHGF